ncbi:MAG: hypothetical protein HQL75_08280 [Magnetococcales bacterium]|nr:hypothetical protein [Magnetococcales bacterium]
MSNHQEIRHCPDGYPVFRKGCQMKWREDYCCSCPHSSRFHLINLVGLSSAASAVIALSVNLLSTLKS